MYFPRVDRWRVPPGVVRSSLEEMALDGETGDEGICLWLGDNDEQGGATISQLVRLRGPGIVKSPANIQIAPELMRQVHEVAQDLGVTLVGQIHSHAPWHGVSLSFVDRQYGISAPYYLSIVAPDYALNAETTLDDCGVHVFVAGSGYVRLTSDQVRRCVLTDLDSPFSILTIGDEDERN